MLAGAPRGTHIVVVGSRLSKRPMLLCDAKGLGQFEVARSEPDADACRPVSFARRQSGLCCSALRARQRLSDRNLVPV